MDIGVLNHCVAGYSLNDLAVVASEELFGVKRNRKESGKDHEEPFKKIARLTEIIKTTERVQDPEEQLTVDVDLSLSTPPLNNGESANTPPLGYEELSIDDEEKGLQSIILKSIEKEEIIYLSGIPEQKNDSFCFSLFARKKDNLSYLLQNFDSINVVGKKMIFKIEDLNDNNIENRIKILFYTPDVVKKTLVAERILFKNQEKHQNTEFFQIAETRNVDEKLIAPEIKEGILKGEVSLRRIRTWRVMAVFLDGLIIYERLVKLAKSYPIDMHKEPSQFFLSLSAEGVKYEVKPSESFELPKDSEIIPEVILE